MIGHFSHAKQLYANFCYAHCTCMIFFPQVHWKQIKSSLKTFKVVFIMIEVEPWDHTLQLLDYVFNFIFVLNFFVRLDEKERWERKSNM